jgi:hypothetical protein
MLKEPKQVPGDHRVVTFQKYTQYFVYGASWFNVDAPEESAALRACVHSLGLRYFSLALLPSFTSFVKYTDQRPIVGS